MWQPNCWWHVLSATRRRSLEYSLPIEAEWHSSTDFPINYVQMINMWGRKSFLILCVCVFCSKHKGEKYQNIYPQGVSSSSNQKTSHSRKWSETNHTGNETSFPKAKFAFFLLGFDISDFQELKLPTLIWNPCAFTEFKYWDPCA